MLSLVSPFKFSLEETKISSRITFSLQIQYFFLESSPWGKKNQETKLCIPLSVGKDTRFKMYK